MIPRNELIQRLKESLDRSRMVALVGPRQCGKTTLARERDTADRLARDINAEVEALILGTKKVSMSRDTESR